MYDCNDLCNKYSFVLPAVYEDTLSAYENVCKLYKAFELFTRQVEEAIADFDSKSKEYTDEQIKIAGEKFNQMAADLNTQFNDFTKLVNNNIEVLNKEFQDTKDSLDAAIVGVNALTDLKIKQNNEYIFDKIDSQLLDVKVVNYFTGAKVTIQEMFDYLAGFHLESAINYKQLAEKNKTVDQYIAYKMTYTELAIKGGIIIT